MILKLYKDIATVVKQINDGNVKLFSYNTNESRFWEWDYASNQLLFNGYKKPEYFPAIAFYVSNGLFYPRNNSVEYIAEFLYLELGDFEKSNPQLIHNKAELALWTLNHLLTRHSCGYRLKRELRMIYFEDKDYTQTTGAYMQAIYSRNAEFDPCCLVT